MKKNWKNNIGGTKYEVKGTRHARTGVPRTSYLILLLTALVLASCTSKDTVHEHDAYTCPMHPQIVRDQPGTCPICGMDLVRKVRPGEEVKVTGDLGKLIKSPNEVVVSSIKTTKGEYKEVSPTIQAQGVVTYDTRKIYTIPARVGGRLEKVVLKYAFQPVQKGHKVAEIYSSELITAQRELLYLLENDARNSQVIESAKNKLLLLGAAETQIENLIKRKEALNTFNVYSPYSGYLIYSSQSAPSINLPAAAANSASGAMGGGMQSGMRSSSPVSQPAPMATGTGSLIREGDYVNAGQTLFKLVNTSALRIELDLPVSQTGTIKAGTDVELDFGDGEIHKATVDFVQPFFDENGEFVKLRVYTRDMQKLTIGQLVKASVKIDPVESLWVPKQAVLDLGLDRIVFIKQQEAFKPVKVTTGIRTDEWIEIKHGLSSADEIAGNAHYMVDSESFIKPSN